MINALVAPLIRTYEGINDEDVQTFSTEITSLMI